MSLSIPIISQFNDKGIKAAIKGFQQLETKGQKAAFVLKKAGQAAAIGFAALGVAAIAGGKAIFDFVQMARADQLAQVQLAKTLKATTNATDDQVAAVESYIDATARATGVADDNLRPAFARLSRSTKNVYKTQRLLNLALDISGRTGKPLEAVVNALGKAYDGSNTALGKLGLGYSKAELKAKSFANIQTELEKSFAGGAAEKAGTFEGTMARLKVTFDEMKESVGVWFLPFLQNVADIALKASDAFGEHGLAGAISEAKYQLKLLFYDKEGNLNSIGENINTFVERLNKFKAYMSGAIGVKVPALIPKQLEQSKGLQEKIDINSYKAGHLRNMTAAGGFGQTVTGLNSKPTTVVNVTVSPLTDPAAVGKEIDKVLALYGRRSGKGK